MKNRLYRAPLDDNLLIAKLTAMIEAGHEKEAVRQVTRPGHSLSWVKTVKLAQQNKVIHDFFASNADLNDLWAQRLREKKFIDYPILSTDGVSVHSVFEQYQGVCFWGDYLQRIDKDSPETIALFNRACECSVFNAWIAKTDKLRSDIEIKGSGVALTELLHALQALNESYWSAGALNAGLVLVDIAGFFKDQGDLERMGSVLEAAIETFYMGFYLLDEPHSLKIMNSLYHEEGWERIFKPYADYAGILNAKDVENKIIDVITQNFDIANPEIFFPRLEASAAKKAEEIHSRFTSEFEKTPTVSRRY